MSFFRFYLKYPLDNTNYSDFVEITEDVLEDGLGDLGQKLSSNDYDIGTVKFNKISVKLRNASGKYSEPINSTSMFTFKRDRSILKIMWNRNTFGSSLGSIPCGHAWLAQPIEVYQGLLEDSSSKFETDFQSISFSFLGLESIVGKVQVPYSVLNPTHTVRQHIYNILNQAEITNILTLNYSNIQVNRDFTPDSITSLENKTCLEALEEILFLSGSVMYVKDATIYVSSRDAGATSAYTFYGPASDTGIENIVNIDGYTTGLNRTFNFFRWKDTTITKFFQDSIDKNGLRIKEVDSELVTTQSVREDIMQDLLTEFGFPKIELNMTVPANSFILNNVFLLDKINIDYPVDYRESATGSLVARYGKSRYGTARYLTGIFSLIIGVTTDWKILNRSMSIKDGNIKFKVREV